MDLIRSDPVFQKPNGKLLGERLYGQIIAIVYPMETAPRKTEDGWLFPLMWGPPKAFVGKGKRPNVNVHIIGTLRAGASDIGSRVPAFAALREKEIGVVGTGALGAPLAIELAKNGCKRLRVLDHDRVEPGNSVRWPLGASAWGEKKVEALQSFVASEYRWSDIKPLDRIIGATGTGEAGDAATLRELEGVNLILDASASFGVTTVVSDWAREQRIPIVSLSASPSVQGGTVAYYAPEGACPTCLEFYHHSGAILPPPGHGKEDTLVQPVGCSERTFSGSSVDLQELSLESARVTIAVLNEQRSESFVETLALIDGDGNRVPPHWRVDQMPVHPDCPCH